MPAKSENRRLPALTLRPASRRAPFPAVLATTCALVSLAWSAAAQKAEWPQWRGPKRTGVSVEAGWKAAGKKDCAWMTNVGLGYSICVISGGRLYTMGHDAEEQQDVVFCLEPSTGLENWVFSFPAETMARGHTGGTQSSPSTDGKHVYICNRECKTFCLDAKTGKKIWGVDLGKKYDIDPGRWGYASSPLILDDMIVHNLGAVYAQDKQTGKVLWKTQRSYGSTYSTPIDVEVAGKPALAAFGGDGLAILDRKTGKEMAFHPFSGGRRSRATASPVVLANERVFISSSGKGCAMLETKADSLEVVWENRSMRPSYTGPIHYGKHLYGLDGSTLKCLDLEGNEKWSHRGLGQGAFTIANGKLVILSGRGDLVIADANPTEFKELHRVNALSGGRYWTRPVVCGGLIYCRNSFGDLVAMDHRQ